MREIFTYGSVGGAPGNRCFYPEMCYKLKPQDLGIKKTGSFLTLSQMALSVIDVYEKGLFPAKPPLLI